MEIGINHEQQHQELLVTDIKYIFGHNPLFPTYHYLEKGLENISPGSINFLNVKGGVYEIGHQGNDFCYDNELGLHKQHINDFMIADRVISNREYLEFIEAGGYSDFTFWLSEGWEWVKLNGIKAPLYWHFFKGEWYEYTLSGFDKLNPDLPVTHISYFEADAFASWKKWRLPTEFEWEVAAKTFDKNKSPMLLESNLFHPQFDRGKYQFLGSIWEWTSSSYTGYPGFKKAEGALGEYNGKFMINQNVLRGGSVATPENHIRKTYRNFFHPHLRWQFTGIRLAQ
jgi:ergothioneine biosynthesis protein EgtB